MSNQNIQNLDFNDISSEVDNYETSFHSPSLEGLVYETNTSVADTKNNNNLERNTERNKTIKKTRAFENKNRSFTDHSSFRQSSLHISNNKTNTPLHNKTFNLPTNFSQVLSETPLDQYSNDSLSSSNLDVKKTKRKNSTYQENRNFFESDIKDSTYREDSNSTISWVVSEFQKKFPEINFGVNIKTYFRQLLISTLYGFIYDISTREIFKIIDSGDNYEFFYTEQRLAPKTKDFREYASILLNSNTSLILEEVESQIKELERFKDWEYDSLSPKQKEEIEKIEIKIPKIKIEEGLSQERYKDIEMETKLQTVQKKFLRIAQKKSEIEQTFEDIQNGGCDYLVNILEYILMVLPKTNIKMSHITTSWSKTYPLIQAVILIFNFEISYIIAEAKAKSKQDVVNYSLDSYLDNYIKVGQDNNFKLIFSSPDEGDNTRSIKKIIQKYLKYTSKRCDQGEVSFVYATCLSFLKEISK